jgi:antitoxin component HigA of HigAB toxin-antitoxin module
MSLAPGSRAATLTATNLPDILTLQGRTLTWLGQQCGLSRFQVSRICSGQRRVTPEMARRSSDLLGVPVHLLFEDRGERAIGADAT